MKPENIQDIIIKELIQWATIAQVTDIVQYIHIHRHKRLLAYIAWELLNE